MTTSAKSNFMPASLVSNLQQVLALKNDGVQQQRSSNASELNKVSSSCCSNSEDAIQGNECVKPVVLVTNGEGIESPGLTFLVQALALDDRLDVCVCAPQLLVSLSRTQLLMYFLPLSHQSNRRRSL